MFAKIIVGLGNPLPEYQATYHNVGKLAVEAISEEIGHGGGAPAFRSHGKLFEYALADSAALVLPLTFMNESGAAVKEAVKKFGGGTENLVIIHDESDLAIGTYKISLGKSAAGHKGVQSIVDALGSKEFLRARIGIRGKNERKRRKASEFVLKKITREDRKALQGIFAEIARELFASL